MIGQKRLINNKNILIYRKGYYIQVCKTKFDLLNMSKKDYAKS